MNGVQTDFITSGIKLLGQKTGENVLLWQVDGNGNTVGFNYNGTSYFYIKNAQGDIIGFTDTSGIVVAKYTYDSWGKLISIKDANDVDKTTDENFIGYINPIRYRGYYYDTETGLYYLNARYYDPEVGRFVNADETLGGGYNLFEYCYNNPVNLIDKNGNRPGQDIIDMTMKLARVVSEESFGKQGANMQWEYAIFAFRKEGIWYCLPCRTDRNSNEVSCFSDIQLISNDLKAGAVDTIIAVHTHPAYIGKSGKWCYQDDLSDTDTSVADRNFISLKELEVSNLYMAVVTASGRVILYDPNENAKEYLVGNIDPDPNIKHINKDCIIS